MTRLALHSSSSCPEAAAEGGRHIADAAFPTATAPRRRTRAFVATAFAALLAVAGAQLLGPALADWRSDAAAHAREAQLAALERQLQRMNGDTARVVQRAKKFFTLQHHAQLASSASSHLVARAEERALAQHARERLERHAFALKQAVVGQKTQNRDAGATAQRLRALNVSLPPAPVERRTQLLAASKAQLLQLQEIERRRQALDDSIVALAADAALETAELAVAEQTVRQRHVDAQIAASLRQLEQQIEAHRRRQAAPSGGALVVYALVMGLTGGYLWVALAERRRRQPTPRQSWSWSPIPKFMVQIRDLLTSAVVIEDLRHQGGALGDASDAEEGDSLGDVLVRKFVPTSKPAPRRRGGLDPTSL